MLNIVDVYLGHMYNGEIKKIVLESTVAHINDRLLAAEIAPLDIGQLTEQVFT